MKKPQNFDQNSLDYQQKQRFSQNQKKLSQPGFQKQKNEIYDQSSEQQQYPQNGENDFRISQKLEIQQKYSYQQDLQYSDDENFQEQDYQEQTNRLIPVKVVPYYQQGLYEPEDEAINHIHNNRELMSQQSDQEEDFMYHNLRGSRRGTQFINEGIKSNSFEQGVYASPNLSKVEPVMRVADQRPFGQLSNIRMQRPDDFDRRLYQDLDYDVDQDNFDNKQIKNYDGFYKQQQLYDGRKPDDLFLEQQNSCNQTNQQKKIKNYNVLAGNLFSKDQNQNFKDTRKEDNDIKKSKIQEAKIGGKPNSIAINKKAEDLFKNIPQLSISQKNLTEQQETDQRQLNQSPQKNETHVQKKQEKLGITKKQISEKQHKQLNNKKINQKIFQSDDENQSSANKNEKQSPIKKVTKNGVKKMKQGFQQKTSQNQQSNQKYQQILEPKISEQEPPKKKGSNQYTAKYAQSSNKNPEPPSPNTPNHRLKKEELSAQKTEQQVTMIATRSKRTISQTTNKNEAARQTPHKENQETNLTRQLRSRKMNDNPPHTRSQLSINNNLADKSKRSSLLSKDETEIRYILELYFEYLCNEFLPPRKISEITVGHIFQKKSYEQDKRIEFSVTNICLTQFSGNKNRNFREGSDGSEEEEGRTRKRRRDTQSKDGQKNLVKSGVMSKRRGQLETPSMNSPNTGSNNAHSGSYGATPNVSQVKSNRRRAAENQSYGKNFRIGDIIDFTQQKSKDLANLYLIKDIKISLDFSGESEKKIEKQNDELPDVLIQFTVFPIIQHYTSEAFPEAQKAMEEIQKHLDPEFKFDKNSSLGLIEVNKNKKIVDNRLDFEKIILNFTQVQKSYAVKFENEQMNTLSKFKTCRETNRHNNSNNYDREYILEYVYQFEKSDKISIFKPFQYRQCENPREFDFIQKEYQKLKAERDWSSDKRKKGGYGEKDHSNQSYMNTSRSPAEREVSQASKQSCISQKSDGIERAKIIQMKNQLEEKYKELNIKPVMSKGIFKKDNFQKKNKQVLSQESSESKEMSPKKQFTDIKSLSQDSRESNQNLRKSRRLKQKQSRDSEQKRGRSVIQDKKSQVNIEINKNQLDQSSEHSDNSNITTVTTRVNRLAASLSQKKRADKFKKFKNTTQNTILETDREFQQSSQKKEDVHMDNQDLTESDHSEQKESEKSSDEPKITRRRQQKGLPSSQTSHTVKSSSSLQQKTMKRVERVDSDTIMHEVNSEKIMSDISKSKSVSALSEVSSHSALSKVKANDMVSEINNSGNDYDKACHSLQLSSLPKNLPCREQEQLRITNFIREGVENKGSSTTLYISGMPGTGKTATTLQVIQKLKKDAQSSTKQFNDFDFIHINGMSLTNPLTVYTIIAEKITGIRMSPTAAVTFLDEFFKKKDKKQILMKVLSKSGKPNASLNKQLEHIANRVRVVLIDEFDGLMTAKQSLFYNLADWPCISNSHLIVMSIANTMDLPEKLQSKIRSRMGDNRLVYEPYNQQQIETIIQARLAGNNIFDQKSIQLISKKVASFSGDIRRSLQIARRAVEITRDQYNTNPTNELQKVTTNQILLASDEMTNSNVVRIMRDLRNLEVVIVIALFLENKNKDVPSLDQVYDRSQVIIQKLDWEDIFFTQQMFRESIKRLQAFGLVNLAVDNNKASVSHHGFYDFVDLEGAYKNHEIYLSEKNNVCFAEKINTN